MKNFIFFLFVFVGLSINAQDTEMIQKFSVASNNKNFSFFIDNTNPLVNGKKKILSDTKTIYKGSLDDFDYERTYKDFHDLNKDNFILKMGLTVVGELAKKTMSRGLESLLTPKNKHRSNSTKGKGIRN